jgi:hypothetical protein
VAAASARVVSYVLPAQLPQTGAGGMGDSSLIWSLSGLTAFAVMAVGASLRVRRWLRR